MGMGVLFQVLQNVRVIHMYAVVSSRGWALNLNCNEFFSCSTLLPTLLLYVAWESVPDAISMVSTSVHKLFLCPSRWVVGRSLALTSSSPRQAYRIVSSPIEPSNINTCGATYILWSETLQYSSHGKPRAVNGESRGTGVYVAYTTPRCRPSTSSFSTKAICALLT